MLPVPISPSVMRSLAERSRRAQDGGWNDVGKTTAAAAFGERTPCCAGSVHSPIPLEGGPRGPPNKPSRYRVYPMVCGSKQIPHGSIFRRQRDCVPAVHVRNGYSLLPGTIRRHSITCPFAAGTARLPRDRLNSHRRLTPVCGPRSADPPRTASPYSRTGHRR